MILYGALHPHQACNSTLEIAFYEASISYNEDVPKWILPSDKINETLLKVLQGVLSRRVNWVHLRQAMERIQYIALPKTEGVVIIWDPQVSEEKHDFTEETLCLQRW